jgi:hypothetical protein
MAVVFKCNYSVRWDERWRYMSSCLGAYTDGLLKRQSDLILLGDGAAGTKVYRILIV